MELSFRTQRSTGTRALFERAPYPESPSYAPFGRDDPALRARLADAMYRARQVVLWLAGVLFAVGLAWLVYSGTLAAILAVFGEQNHTAVPVVLTIVIDLALLSAMCVVFFRWLGTQPNPVDS
jgi:hypothetical protein